MNPRTVTSLLLLGLGVAVGILLFAAARRATENRIALSPANSSPNVHRSRSEPRLNSAVSGAAVTENGPVADLRAELVRALNGRDARANEALLSFNDAAAYQRFLGRAQHRGLAVLGQLDRLLTVRVRYDSLDALEADLRENSSDFSNVSANMLVRIPAKPIAESRDRITEVPFANTTLAFLGVPADHADWGRGVRIAVLDSGVAPDPTFSGSRVQYLDVGLGTLPGRGSEDGHGTAVASLASGLAADAPGVAPAATVVSIRVTDTNGLGDIFTVARAILAAVDAGAPVINLSLGGYSTAPALSAAIDYARVHGTVLVAAAGNDQAAQLTWPAADPRVISVGAVDARAQQVTFSNSGPQLQITAPGYGVQTAWADGQRVYVDGTSASAPLVAGAIAAVMSKNPALTANQAWDVVRQTTSDAGPPGADSRYGTGVLNLDWAMNYTNPTRLDPAIASHYYDSANQQMDVVVQNRSAGPVSSLALDVDANGSTQRYRLPTLGAGASYVLKLPVYPGSGNNGSVDYTTALVTPIGLQDANPANNQLSTRVVLIK